MPQLIFRVLSPAMQPPMGSSPPMPDPTPMYGGGMANGSTFMPPFGNALVTGGAKVGNKWLGCTYMCPPYTIPGLGEVEQLGV